MVRESYPPSIEKMIANPGLYVLFDARYPRAMVPVISNAGKLYSMNVDEELDPSRFILGGLVDGPVKYLSERTDAEKENLMDL